MSFRIPFSRGKRKSEDPCLTSAEKKKMERQEAKELKEQVRRIQELRSQKRDIVMERLEKARAERLKQQQENMAAAPKEDNASPKTILEEDVDPL